MDRMTSRGLLITLLWLLSMPPGFAAHQAGESVLIRGEVGEDLYVAGGRVDVLAEVDGDVLATGGDINIDSVIAGDLLVVGGEVMLHGRVEDDARLVGGDIMINATVDDDAVAAGGNVLLAPGAYIKGDAMLAGGVVDLAGRVKGNASMAGGELKISGQIDGNADLAGESIEIGPSAVIRGNLTYRSPQPAFIHELARIEGQVVHIETPTPDPQEVFMGMVAAALFLWISLALTGVVLYLALPGATLASARNIGAETWKSLGLGLAVLAVTPLLVFLLMVSGVGWMLAMVLMLGYFLLLLLGFLIGVLSLGDAFLRKIRAGREPSRLANSLLFIILLLLVTAVGMIPLLGWLLVLLLLLLGVGGSILHLHRSGRLQAA